MGDWLVGRAKEGLTGFMCLMLSAGEYGLLSQTSALGHALGFYINFLYISFSKFSLLLLCAFLLLLLYFWEDNFFTFIFLFPLGCFFLFGNALISRAT